MSDSVRIRTTPNGGDKYIKLKLDQKFDFVEILSLKLTQEDAYQNFCSDYGVVVGRVIVNSGFGVPNAKVSIFIPLDEIDKEDSVIKGLYPYEIVTDKNSEGIRYNVLPKNSSIKNPCFTEVGTLPNKREVLDNSKMSEVYCKYYKFTTTTNYAGDFMIFGVPVGTHTLHVDVDLSDIGPLSQRPYDFTREGYSPKLFETTTKFKGGSNLDKLPQIKSTNIGVNVQPFWGDLETCEIGITRADVDLNFTISPNAIFLGSIYGDQDKNSVNKYCNPRAKTGQICEQSVGAGSVEMIRKNLNDDIEEFSVEGGKVIDDDGVWAFQIPMNLDYVVTDEVGDFIPSNDPNIGVPTRSRVRFKISMDETGGEGKLRTRAKYLVPNNPQNQNEFDYNFNENTKESSFRDISWNKIYTISNFIPRFQRGFKGVLTRNMTGMKDIDACPGTRTPFPFNKVNTTINPIFFIICLIMKIIGFIVYIINYILLFIINAIVKLIRSIVDFLNGFPGVNLAKPDYVPCVSIECPALSGYRYAPGCRGCQNVSNCPDTVANAGFNQAAANGLPITYFCGDSFGGQCTGDDLLVGLDDCIAFEMAKTLNLFQFDFYNDWVVGTLYTFLLKYKKRTKGFERFCEFDCADFSGTLDYSGVDGNKDAKPDNKCYNQELLDTCYSCDKPPGLLYANCQRKSENFQMREGLIKKYDNELYYAATLHKNPLYKLFATELVCLGSVLECDWQGYPKLQPFLIESTYKLPPETAEIEEQSDGTNLIVESGMVSISEKLKGVFFDINCTGIHVNTRQCLNLRHICEFGVDSDEVVLDPSTGAVVLEADSVIGTAEIDETNRGIRNSYTYINNSQTFPTTYSIPQNFNSDFNLANADEYDFAAGLPDNGNEYAEFRGYVTSQSFDQPKHSYFIYFGMVPGKSALAKMNSRYFITCKTSVKTDVSVTFSATPALTNCDGQIELTFIGGQEPYYFTVTSSNTTLNNTPQAPYYYSGNTEKLLTPTVTLPPSTLNGLCSGTYVVSGFDSLGYPISQTIALTGPLEFSCFVGVSQNITTPGTTDGEITIYNIIGGTPPYQYTLLDSNNNNNILIPPTVAQAPVVISTLSLGEYIVKVTDSSTPPDECITTGITISGPTQLNVSPTIVDASCPNIGDGKITLTISGGQPMYSIETVGITDPNFVSNSGVVSGLFPGDYQVTVTDSSNPPQIWTDTVTVASPQSINITAVAPNVYQKQCSPNSFTIPFIATDGGTTGPKTIEYRLNLATTWSIEPTIQPYNTPNQVMDFNILGSYQTISFRLVGNGNCRSNTLTYYSVQKPSIALAVSSNTKTGPFNSLYTYNLTVVGGIGAYTATANPQSNSTITVNGANIIITSPSSTLTITITDSVGCQTSIIM
jgi:hypothetical protein